MPKLKLTNEAVARKLENCCTSKADGNDFHGRNCPKSGPHLLASVIAFAASFLFLWSLTQ